MLFSEGIVQLINGIATAHLGQSVILRGFLLGECLCQWDVIPADFDRLVFLYLACDVHLFLYVQLIRQHALGKEQIVDNLIGVIDDIARNNDCQ